MSHNTHIERAHEKIKLGHYEEAKALLEETTQQTGSGDFQIRLLINSIERQLKTTTYQQSLENNLEQ